MNSKLKNIVREAYTKVPLYINMAAENEKSIEDVINGEFESISFTEKDEIVKNGNNALSIRYMPMLNKNQLMHTMTSGSTGKYMDIYWERSDFAKSMIPLWLLRKKYYDILPSDRMCYFFTIRDTDIDNEKDDYKEKNSWGFSKINLSAARIMEIYKKMCEYKPKWLLLQPSIAVLLCRCIKNNKLEKLDSIKYIEFSGEILTEEVRKMVKEIFNCKIANQYGANEFNSIAYECPCGNMHVMDSNVYVEVLDAEGESVNYEKGEICVTTLTNNAMPLIRYKIGDIGMLTDKKCSCGNHAPIISLISGRKNDYVLCEDGTRVTAYVFVRAVDNVNMLMDRVIKQFNIIQRGINNFLVKFVVDFEEIEDKEQLEQLFVDSVREDRLYEAVYEFQYSEYLLPGDKTGKYSYFKRL